MNRSPDSNAANVSAAAAANPNAALLITICRTASGSTASNSACQRGLVTNRRPVTNPIRSRNRSAPIANCGLCRPVARYSVVSANRCSAWRADIALTSTRVPATSTTRCVPGKVTDHTQLDRRTDLTQPERAIPYRDNDFRRTHPRGDRFRRRHLRRREPDVAKPPELRRHD